MARFLVAAAGAAVAAAAVFAVVRFGGDDPAAAPSGDPGTFMTRLVRQIASNDYDRAWATLHPMHQNVVTRGDYVECETRSPIPGRLASVAVLGVTDERVRLAGLGGTVAGKAIRVRLTFSGADDAEPVVVNHTGHAVAVGRRWAWILPPARFEDYRAGRCPDA